MTSLRFVLRTAVTLSAILSLSSSNFVAAESPTLSSITPAGVRRGSEVEVRLTGANLSDNPQVMLYYPGIKVKSVGPLTDKNGVANENVAVATLAVAPDCRLGIHALRVRTDTGLTTMPLLFTVGDLPETAEVEPNNDADTAQSVPFNNTLTGIVQPEDVDYFAIDLKKGERISAEVEGMRLGRTAFDPYIAILDADKKELARSDDEAFGWYDAVTSVVAPRDGKYYVMIRESTFGGSGGAVYRLHVGNFPRPTAVIPAGGKPGEKLEVTYLGDAGGPWKQTITVPTKPEFYSTFNPGDQRGTPLFPTNKYGTAPSPLIFRVNDLNNVVEKEPNDDATQSIVEATAPIAFNGIIEKAGDVDHFAFRGEKGKSYDVRVHARSIRSPLDSVLTITRKSNGSSAGQNDDSGTPDSYLRINCQDDVYVVQVKDMLNHGGPNFVYRVEVTPIEPTIYMTVAEKALYIDTICAVPQGNRGAVLLNATKRDFAAELQLAVAGLPKGMKFESVPMAANQTLVPLLLTAADDAPTADAILDVTANSTDPKVPGTGRLWQASQLLRVNNRPVYEHTIQRLSAAVVKKAPFKIEVEKPKVPLVRSGSMDLKVRAIREPGFTAPIDIRMLYSPAGTAASVSAQIPEGQNEGTLYINAGPTAEIRTWQIIVLGSAAVGKGRIEVASAMTPLEIGEPYFELAFKAGSVEQGKDFQFTVPLTNLVEFKGKAKLQLIGLPDEAVCEPIEITQDDTTAVFHVTTTGKTPVGRHKAIMCSLIVTKNGEPINHTLGPGEIRVDPPTKTRATAAAGQAGSSNVAAKPNDKPADPAKNKPSSVGNKK
jgi:hypothetical protein